MCRQTSWKVWVAASLCAASVLTVGLSDAQTPGQSPSDARALLLRMADLIGKTQRLSVTVPTTSAIRMVRSVDFSPRQSPFVG